MNIFNRIRKRIYEIIGPSRKGDFLSIIYDIIICLLVILSSISVFIEIIGVNETISAYLLTFEYVVVGIFIFDYLLHILTCDFHYPECKSYFKALKEYVTSFDSLIDIISVLSVLLNGIPKGFAALRLVKLVKLVRLVKLSDYFGNKETQKKGFLEKAQARVHEIIAKDTHGDVASKIYDIVSLTLILLSVVLIVLDTFDFAPWLEETLHIAEIVIACVFALEYILRIWTAPLEYPNARPDKARMKYIFSFMALIDLLSIIPVFVSGIDSSTAILKIFKVTKILRLVKASRYLHGIVVFGEAVKKKAKAIVFSMVIMAFLVILSSILLYGFEHSAQPEVYKNGFSGIYYSFMSIIGGESDAGPITQIGTFLSILMTILGACVVGVPTAIIADEFSGMVFKSSGVEVEKEEGEKQETSVEDLVSAYNSLSEENKKAFVDKIQSK